MNAPLLLLALAVAESIVLLVTLIVYDARTYRELQDVERRFNQKRKP